MKRVLLFALLPLVAACSTPAPAARWEKTSELAVPLALSWPPLVNVLVEGPKAKAKARLMVDTGAEESALDDRFVERLGLERTWTLNSVQGFDEAQGGVGSRTVFQREVKAVSLAGACRLEDLRIVPLPMPASRDGVLGLAAFPGRAVILDPVKNELTFVTRSSVPGIATQPGAIEVPVRREGNLLVAHVVLRSNQGTFARDMVLDTGASDSFLTEDALDEMHGDARDATYLVRLGTLGAGNHSFRIERGGKFCTLGGDVLLDLGRAVLFDLEGARVVILPRAR